MLTPEQPATGSFNAVPGNLGSFMSSVQAQHVVTEPEPEPIETPEDIDDTVDFGEEEPEQKVVPTNSGRALARFVDKGWAFGAGLYAHAPSEKYRSTSQEMEELEEAFVDFLNDTGINISPAINLIIAVVAIYAFKIGDVVRDRKENLLREAAEEEARKPKQLPEEVSE